MRTSLNFQKDFEKGGEKVAHHSIPGTRITLRECEGLFPQFKRMSQKLSSTIISKTLGDIMSDEAQKMVERTLKRELIEREGFWIWAEFLRWKRHQKSLLFPSVYYDRKGGVISK